MTDGDALHRAVLASPAEDTPRLVYADALDERRGPGDAAHAALIRWQIETGVGFWRDIAAGRWRNKAARGVRDGPPECWQALNSFLSWRWPGAFAVRRGFVDEVWCGATDWLGDWGASARCRHPIRAVRFDGPAPACDRVAIYPADEYPAGAYVLRGDVEFGRVSYEAVYAAVQAVRAEQPVLTGSNLTIDGEFTLALLRARFPGVAITLAPATLADARLNA